LRDLSVSYSKIGNVEAEQGDLATALQFYRDDCAIAERLAKAEPEDLRAQRDLAGSYVKLGSTLAKAGQRDEARQRLTAGRTILATMVEQHPERAQWKDDLASLDRDIAGLDRPDTPSTSP
jgi:hypothetical protein